MVHGGIGGSGVNGRPRTCHGHAQVRLMQELHPSRPLGPAPCLVDMTLKEKKSFYAYSHGVDNSLLTLGSLVLEDYANPESARTYVHVWNRSVAVILQLQESADSCISALSTWISTSW